MATNSNTRPAAARAFVRSLNILLKFARMYDFGHPRTVRQFETGWSELRIALGSGSENEAGVLLGVSGDQLLLDGTPLESAAAEKSFAKMLSSAGIASIHFSPKVTQASLARFVRAFPTGTGAKPVQLAEQLKTALQGDPHIHVNEVCFVPADSAVAKSTIAAQLAARTIGLNAEKSDELFNDPERLLQLIIAAEGTKGSSGSSRTGGLGGDGGGDGSGNGSGNVGAGGSGDGSGGSGNGFDGSGSDSGRGNGFESSGGQGSGTGGYASGPGYYAVESAEIIRGIPAGQGEPGAHGLRMSGLVSSIGGSEGGTGSGAPGGSGTWNIIGGSGVGTPLEPDAGGFWFNKEGSKQSSGEGQVSGTRISGGSPVVGADFSSESRSSDFGTWNIVGGSEEGAPLDPNAGGFWLNKENSKESGS